MIKYEAQYDGQDGWCVIEWSGEDGNEIGYAIKTNLPSLKEAESYAALYDKTLNGLTSH